MADLVLTNPYVLVNAVDLSAFVREVSIDFGVEEQDNTKGNATGTKSNIGGFKDWTMVFTLAQDFVDNSVDEQMFALVGTSPAIEVRPAQGARSVNNPGYNATGLLVSYPPLGQAVGDYVTTQVTFRPGGTLPTLLRSVA